MEGVSHYIVTRTSVAGNCGDTVSETVDAVSLLCDLHINIYHLYDILYVGFIKCSTSVQKGKVSLSSVLSWSRGKSI